MKKTLFIAGAVQPNSAQGIRYRYLLTHLADHTKIILFSITDIFAEKPVNIETSSFGKGFANIASATSGKNFILFAKHLFKKIIEPFIFPDKFRLLIPSFYKRIRGLLLEENFDSVIIAMTPFSFYLLSRKIRDNFPDIKIIVDLSDPFTGNKGINYKFNFYKKLIKNFEQKYLKYVDDIVVLNPAIKKFYISQFGSSYSDKIHVIEQGIDDYYFKADFLQKKTEQKSKKNTIILTYAGRFYRFLREPFELYLAVKKSAGMTLEIYGKIRKEFIPEKIDNIRFQGEIPKKDLLEKYINTDIIVFIDNASGLQVPGKLLELIAFKKPVLFIFSNSDSPSLPYIENIPFVYPCKNNKTAISDTIEHIVTERNNVFPELDLSQYSWSNLANKYGNIIFAD